jgi:hypothetical protein
MIVHVRCLVRLICAANVGHCRNPKRRPGIEPSTSSLLSLLNMGGRKADDGSGRNRPWRDCHRRYHSDRERGAGLLTAFANESEMVRLAASRAALSRSLTISDSSMIANFDDERHQKHAARRSNANDNQRLPQSIQNDR